MDKIFTVEGRGPFPVDMLRYDECVFSSHAMESRAYPQLDLEHVKRRVTLVHRGRGVDRFDSLWYPTSKRWESFGWHVVDGASPWSNPPPVVTKRDELEGKALALLHEAKEAGYNMRIDIERVIERAPSAPDAYINTVHVWEKRK